MNQFYLGNYFFFNLRTFLPPPPKVVPPLSVCVQHISKSCGQIRTKFCGQGWVCDEDELIRFCDSSPLRDRSVESNEECSHGHEAGRSGLAHAAGFAAGQSGSSPRPGKKTRGRVKIKMEFINNKLRRYTTFSKRKTGIMKKAYELSTLTGTQVMLLVASETGHVYTFATRKLQPMITSESGKALIQTCLNSPDSPPRPNGGSDQRMSATGFEETELSYAITRTLNSH
uniref:Serum response factor n=1 Tax=Eptatretus burgeri TaxID=7764 RepID=A0A8C4N1U7_EPTBU